MLHITPQKIQKLEVGEVVWVLKEKWLEDSSSPFHVNASKKPMTPLIKPLEPLFALIFSQVGEAVFVIKLYELQASEFHSRESPFWWPLTSDNITVRQPNEQPLMDIDPIAQFVVPMPTSQLLWMMLWRLVR